MNIDWIQNLSERKKQIIIGCTSMIAGVGILIGYFQSGPDAMRYASAEAAFAKWDASPQDDQLYQSLKEAIRSVPALQKKYEATIAQNLMVTDRIDEALVMANRALARVKEDVPYHSGFAENSFLIEQGHFQQALENAVALKERMGETFLSEEKSGGLLYLHNLLRIACLQQELNNRPGEKAAWEELEMFLEKDSLLAQKLRGSFSEKQVDLSQYISERKKVL
jgi:hypothetical protein